MERRETEIEQINAADAPHGGVVRPCDVRGASLVAVTCDDPAMIANMALALAGLIDYTDL